jgi:hypothetical protein
MPELSLVSNKSVLFKKRLIDVLCNNLLEHLCRHILTESIFVKFQLHAQETAFIKACTDQAVCFDTSIITSILFNDLIERADRA